jgi:hypothetical protein
MSVFLFFFSFLGALLKLNADLDPMVIGATGAKINRQDLQSFF